MKKIKVTIFFLMFILTINCISSAHPGRTDSNGGHYDRSTGEYHYHNGGTTTTDSNNKSNNNNYKMSDEEKADELLKVMNGDKTIEDYKKENGSLQVKIDLLEGKVEIYENDLKEAGFNSIADMKKEIEHKDSEISGLWTIFIIIFIIGIIIAYKKGKNNK